MRLKIQLVILLLGLGLALASGWFLFRSSSPPKSQEGIGWIQSVNGSIHLSRAGESTRIQSRTLLSDGDQIATGVGSEGEVQFLDGTLFRIVEDSQIQIRQVVNRTLIEIQRGQLLVENSPPGNSFIILKNGNEIPSDKYETHPAFKEPILLGRNAPPNSAQPGTVPSETDITQLFEKQQGAFFKCYGQVLQIHPQARGEVRISLLIQGSGKAAEISLHPQGEHNGLHEPNFQKCLTEVISRMRFQEFSGPPIALTYPLKFE